MSLREKLRKQKEAAGELPELSTRDKYLQQVAEDSGASVPLDPMEQAGMVTRPTTAMTPADEARKAYLREAKARTEATKKEFEDRVKTYFAKGLEVEQAKLAAGSVGPKKSKKEENKDAMESGLFLAELKSIGLDVGAFIIMRPLRVHSSADVFPEAGGNKHQMCLAPDTLPSRSLRPPLAPPGEHTTLPHCAW